MTKPVPAGLAGLADFRPSATEVEGALPPARARRSSRLCRAYPVAPRKRRKGADEPTYSITARVTVRSADAFIALCERERLTYREGFHRLVALLKGVGDKGLARGRLQRERVVR